MIEELQAKLIALEQRFLSHEQEDLRTHARFNEKLREKADKDDIQQLRQDIREDFQDRDAKIRDNHLDIRILDRKFDMAKVAMGGIITFLGAVGYGISWLVDRWDKIKGYLP